MKLLKKVIRNGLIAFVLISIGFALGKHSVKPVATVELHPDQGSYVVVYYMHSTFRCVTCNTIEEMTRDFLELTYSEDLRTKQIRWVEVDFQENEVLAKQFEVITSCVVVAEVQGGVVVEFKRLDEVWTLMKDPEAFNKYIGDAIDGYLTMAGGQS